MTQTPLKVGITGGTNQKAVRLATFLFRVGPQPGTISIAMAERNQALLFAQIATGLWIAVGYRWGSFWGTGVFVPWIWSLLTFRPRPELVANIPLVLQTHVTLFWMFLVVFPFTRLVHIITVPFQYVIRPWQIVTWVRRDRVPRKQEIPERVRTGV